MEVEDDLREFAHMWDGSENWHLSASRWTKATLTVVFVGDNPSLEELVALRRLREEFRALPIAKCKALLAGRHEVRLSPGTLGDPDMKELILGGYGEHFYRFFIEDADKILERATQLEVPFEIRPHIESGIDYAPIQVVDGREWMMLIDEDDELAERVEREMLRHGVPVIFNGEH